MSWRSFGAIEFLRSVLPDAAVPVFAVLTHLGDVGLLFVVLAVIYWFGDWDRGAALLGITLGGLALTVLLKATFELPRPPAPLQATVVEGYGFPSGHAIASTVTWGSLAMALDVGTRRSRYAAASLVVAVVCLSRVVIGVHFLADVIVGVLIGGTYLVVAFAVTELDPDRSLVLAFGIAVAATIAAFDSAVLTDGVMVLGGTLGAAVTWRFVGEPVDWHTSTARLAASALALVGLGGVAYALDRVTLPLPVVLVGFAVVFAGILSLPIVTHQAHRLVPVGGTPEEVE